MHHPPRIGSLCSGYGGLEMGIQAALGGTVAWHAEIDRDASRVLAHRWPEVPNHGDITTADWSRAAAIDILAVGFPCQKLSLNGRRGGLLAVDHADSLIPSRAPWQGAVEAIATLRPRLVVIENVRGLLSAPVMAVGPDSEAVGGAFGRVLGDLADLGFDAEWICAAASDLAGAPHQRRRVFLVASPADTGSETRPRWTGLRSSEQTEVRGARPNHSSLASPEEWGHLRSAIDRWARVVGRPAPAGLVLGPAGGLVTNPWFMEWLMGLPEGHVCGVPGVSAEAQRRLLGNGVVWQQAAAAVQLLLPRFEVEGIAA